MNTFTGTNNVINFRAKLIACMIAVIKDDKPQLEQIIKNVAKDIYKDNLKRNIFLAIINNYIKIAKQNTLGIDKLLNDIKKITLKNPKYKRYINLAQLNKLVLIRHQNENETEIEDYSQIRVLEFLKNEVIK